MLELGAPLIVCEYTVARLGAGPVIVTDAPVQPDPVTTKDGVIAVTSGRGMSAPIDGEAMLIVPDGVHVEVYGPACVLLRGEAQSYTART